MISDFIKELLYGCKNVVEGWYRKNITETHTSFVLLQATPLSEHYSDSENIAEVVDLLYTFDIWGENETDVKNEYKKMFTPLCENKFIWEQSIFKYEEDTRTYHYALRFNYFLKDNEYEYI